MHNLSATIAFVSLTGALFIAGAWLVKSRRGVLAVAATYALGIAAMIAQGLLAAKGVGGDAGLYQRVALGALQLWVAVFALHLMTWKPMLRDHAAPLESGQTLAPP